MAKRACPRGRVLCEYRESGVGKGLSTWGALTRGSETKLVSFMTPAHDNSPSRLLLLAPSKCFIFLSGCFETLRIQNLIFTWFSQTLFNVQVTESTFTTADGCLASGSTCLDCIGQLRGSR